MIEEMAFGKIKWMSVKKVEIKIGEQCRDEKKSVDKDPGDKEVLRTKLSRIKNEME